MEESPKPTPSILSEQTGIAQASTSERQEQVPKKEYHCPKLAVLGDVRIVTRDY